MGLNDEANKQVRLQKAVTMSKVAAEKLDDPIFVEIKERLEKAYSMGWRAAKTVEDREMYWHRMQVLDEVIIALQATRSAGTLAANMLEQEQKVARVGK